jgi:hypothetical protein
MHSLTQSPPRVGVRRWDHPSRPGGRCGLRVILCSFRTRYRNGPARPSAAGRTRPPGPGHSPGPWLLSDSDSDGNSDRDRDRNQAVTVTGTPARAGGRLGEVKLRGSQAAGPARGPGGLQSDRDRCTSGGPEGRPGVPRHASAAASRPPYVTVAARGAPALRARARARRGQPAAAAGRCHAGYRDPACCGRRLGEGGLAGALRTVTHRLPESDAGHCFRT